MQETDLIRVRHMLEAAREAVSFAAHRSRKDLDTNRMLVLSLVKAIEIIGEAAVKVTAEIKSANPRVPWADLIGMRHRLIHAYFDVDLDIVWDTVNQDLPPLIAELERMISTGTSEHVDDQQQ